MARGLLGKLASRALSVAGKSQHQQLRRLNIHEYQGAELMGKFGINVPKGAAAGSIEEVKNVMKNMFSNEKEMVVKSQILAGGRGLGTFQSGLKGGVHIVKVEETEDIAGKMLGQILVTKQTGPQGKVVSKVYLCEKLSLVNEMYFAITLDRTTAGPIIIACKKGGTSIEDLAEKFPDMIIKVPIDVFNGISDEDAEKVVDGLAPKVADRNAAMEQVNARTSYQPTTMAASTASAFLSSNSLLLHHTQQSHIKPHGSSSKKMMRAKAEREILQMLDHPFLPTLYTHFTTDNLSCLVMEYCPGLTNETSAC